MYIFDLDSTLANIDHRLPHQDTRDGGAKALFNALCVNDTPIPQMCRLFRTLDARNFVRIWTGRTEAVREQTLDWIAKHVDARWAVIARDFPKMLMMRPVGDRRPDNELKLMWLNALSPTDRSLIEMAFDDRDRVVKMYRDNGIMCLQVADGNF